ncbi:hypothetical protein ACFL43_00370 [Thermodesulfobacteriota bacterium]
MEHTSSVSADYLKEADKETQISVMRDWFFQHYEDPVDCLPHDPDEGGYMYLWGGPYTADEVLLPEFEDIIPKEVIKEQSEELNEECFAWSGKQEDYYEDYSDAVLDNTAFHNNFTDSINRIADIGCVKITDELQEHLEGLLFSSVITALETYLSDAFINTVLSDKEKMRKFVETNKDFKDIKFSLDQAYSIIDSIDKKIKEYLFNLMWHNLEKVKIIYKKTLGIRFPDDMSAIHKHIKIRHDLVHRGGKDKNGNQITVTDEDLSILLDDVMVFVEDMTNNLEKYNSSIKINITIFREMLCQT